MWGMTFRRSLQMFSPESYWELQLRERLQTPKGIAFVERELTEAKNAMRRACDLPHSADGNGR